MYKDSAAISTALRLGCDRLMINNMKIQLLKDVEPVCIVKLRIIHTLDLGLRVNERKKQEQTEGEEKLIKASAGAL